MEKENERIHSEDLELLQIFNHIENQELFLEKIKVLRINPVYIRHPKTNRNILLHSIEQKVNKNIIYSMIKNFGVDIDEFDEVNNDNALLLCCEVGYFDMVVLLCEMKVDYLKRNKNKESCLILCAKNRHYEIFSYLLELENFHRIINSRENTYMKNTLMILIEQNSFFCVKLLLESPVSEYIDYGACDIFGNTAIKLAVILENCEICELLLNKISSIKLSVDIDELMNIVITKNNYKLMNILQCFINTSTGNEEAIPSSNMTSEIHLKNISLNTENSVNNCSLIKHFEKNEQNTNNIYTVSKVTSNIIQETYRTGLKKKVSISSRKKRNYSQQTNPLIVKTHRKTSSIGIWNLFIQFTTILFFPSILEKVFKIKGLEKQQAWKEKITLCIIILFMSVLGLSVSFGVQDKLSCEKKEIIYENTLKSQYSMNLKNPNSPKYVSVRGSIFDVSSYFSSGSHASTPPSLDEDLENLIEGLYGNDISRYFPTDPTISACKTWPENYYNYTRNSINCDMEDLDKRMHCHTSLNAVNALSLLKVKNTVSFNWGNITEAMKNMDKLIVIKDKVYRITNYLQRNQTYLGEKMTNILRNPDSRDATKEFLRNPDLQEMIPCLDDMFLVGNLEGLDFGCFASNMIMISLATLLLLVSIIKTLGSGIFNIFLSKTMGKQRSTLTKFVKSPFDIVFLVTCYSESSESIKCTLDSIASCDYPNFNKLIFVVSDGDITGSGNENSTPDILKELLTPYDNSEEIKEKDYISIGSSQHNTAKVYNGYYVYSDNKVPYILVVKTGTSQEKKGPAPGNRGKRDSQLILMNLFNKVFYNESMSPLEYDLIVKTNRVTDKELENYDLVLMVDADTQIMKDSISIMSNTMENDDDIIGLCGETKICNKNESWVTKIQVFEYFMSHHLGKSFESMFGGVSCLPGCFSMYRLKVQKGVNKKYYVPLLANDDIVKQYSSGDTSTLHKKNLLLLGEDRYLSTLMLKTFTKRKMMYVPQAVCKTNVPSEFKVLLSQRRRWINSTVHNLLELVLVSQLCGIFCCSMQFIVFLELIGTFVLPMSVLYLFYTTVSLFFNENSTTPFILIVISMVLQPIMVIVFSRKPSYFYWFLVYLLAFPIWNFIFPIYAFWNFDDFSWGSTRKTKKINNNEVFVTENTTKIISKRFQEWSNSQKKNNTCKVFNTGNYLTTREVNIRRQKLKSLNKGIEMNKYNSAPPLGAKSIDEGFPENTNILHKTPPTTKALKRKFRKSKVTESHKISKIKTANNLSNVTNFAINSSIFSSRDYMTNIVQNLMDSVINKNIQSTVRGPRDMPSFLKK